MKTIDFMEIGEIQVGHAQDEAAGTGCTVILAPKGAVAGVDVRGGAPGTRETDLLNPVNLVQEVHGILLTGALRSGWMRRPESWPIWRKSRSDLMSR